MQRTTSGNVYRYCACLVTRSFSQVTDVKFFDTYITKTTSIRIALAFAARHDFKVHQVDMKLICEQRVWGEQGHLDGITS